MKRERGDHSRVHLAHVLEVGAFKLALQARLCDGAGHGADGDFLEEAEACSLGQGSLFLACDQ